MDVNLNINNNTYQTIFHKSNKLNSYFVYKDFVFLIVFHDSFQYFLTLFSSNLNKL